MNFFNAGYCRRLNGEAVEFGPISESGSENEDDDKFDCWCGNVVWWIDEIKGGRGKGWVVVLSSCNEGLSLLSSLSSDLFSSKNALISS